MHATTLLHVMAVAGVAWIPCPPFLALFTSGTLWHNGAMSTVRRFET